MAQNVHSASGVGTSTQATNQAFESVVESNEKTQSPKTLLKDRQVITSIIKEEGIEDFEPKCVHYVTDFVYKYITNVLEEARAYSHAPKSGGQKTPLDVDDVRLAIQLYGDSMFMKPPQQDEVVPIAKKVNATPLPEIKPHCGIRLPTERHCVTVNNYASKWRSKTFASKTMNSNLMLQHTTMRPLPPVDNHNTSMIVDIKPVITD